MSRDETPLRLLTSFDTADLGWLLHKQVHVIVLAIELDQFALEVGAHAGEDAAQFIERPLVEDAPAVLGDEGEVHVQIEDAVATRAKPDPRPTLFLRVSCCFVGASTIPYQA